ncbi:lysophospholipid acyltransferase family protein [Verrucomicrobiota bacterium]
MKYRAKHIAEYAGVEAAAGLFRLLPYRAALCLGWLVAGAGFGVLRPRVRTAESRIREVFGGQFSSSEIRRIAWTSWRNLVFNAVEMARAPRIDLNWILSVSECRESLDRVKRHADTGQGAILAVPHMGNWEMAAVAGRLYGIPIFSIAGRQRNPLVNRYIESVRSASGIPTLERGQGALKSVVRRLREGGIFAILPDVRMAAEGVPVRFLGANANLGAGMAVFARHTGVPIFPCLALREGWRRHRFVTGDPVFPDLSLSKRADIERMMATVMSVIEDAVRTHPEQWFWYNRRWVLEPHEAPGTGAGV